MTSFKIRSDSALSNLTEEQQAQLYDWIVLLGCPQAKVQLAKPEPEGFGVAAHITSLRRFFRRYSATLKIEEIEDAEQLAVQAKSQPSTPLRNGAEEAMHHAAFQFSTAPLDPDTFNHLSRWLTKQKAYEQKAEYIQIARDNLAVARERLALDREKMELNCARLALKHFLELQEIYKNPAWDDEDKVRAAREKLFPKPQQ